MSVNKVILVGNVGKDPEVRHLDKGVAVANFSLATTENYLAKNGEKVSTTEWHNIVVWRSLAEFAEKYITKGRQLYIEGRLKTRSWDDKDGNKRYTTEVFADVIQLLGRKEEGGAPSSGSQVQETMESVSEPDFSRPEEDDLPF